MPRISVATLSSPEFIDIHSISPFASQCEVKVLYLGGNRNGSYITKEVATEMAQTLPGCPIVGYYSENAEDFRDHGDQVIIDGDGVKFNCLTTPFGFVAPDAKVWFKDFEEQDEFGNKVIRTYLMTQGYLWTEQYKAAQKVINEGRPQSMELDEKTLKGHWSKDVNRGIDFFIINDAIFSKLCILGEDVEPCFEGASVTAPNISSTFSKENDFAKTLYSMMNELKQLTYSLQEGGKTMDGTENINVQASAEEPAVTPEAPAAEDNTATPEENFSNAEDKVDSAQIAENQNITEEFAKKDEDEKKPESDDETDKGGSSDSKEEGGNDDKEDDEDKKKKASKNTLEDKYALLEQELSELKDKYSSLENQNKELVAFKAEVEDAKKTELINSFYMLSDEDKKDVVENKAKYTLEEIESKLSVICVRKKVSFDLNKEEENEVATTFNLQGSMGADDVPAWIKAVEERRKKAN